jgi:predicted acetyltransferase
MTEIEIGSLGGEDELQAFAGIIGSAFGFPALEARIWLEWGGLAEVRVARRGRRLLGGLLRVPMGQWFGGRSVSMLGLAGVAVAPEARGKKVALSLVNDALRTARAAGVPLSALYPATVRLYRASGYELAGSRFRFRGECRDLPVVRGELEVQPILPGDAAKIEELYARIARERPGYLDRGPYVWRRVRESRSEAHVGYQVSGGAGIEGYAYLSHKGAMPDRELVLHDLVAATARAAECLLALVADHRSTIRSFSFHGTPADALLFALPERVFRSEIAEHFMLRILDAERALALRGYPELELAVDLDLTDALFSENAGRYRLEVSGGSAQVKRGGSGAVRLSERALAALYSGFLSPYELARTHELSADQVSLARLSAIFAGAPPSMADMF